MFQTTDYRRAIILELETRGLLRKDLARALGNSEAWVSLMLKGNKKLDAGLAERICTFFRFDSDQTAYFCALVDLENPSPRARRTAWATVQAMQRQRQSVETLTEDAVCAQASWYVQAIGELARCEGFRADPHWIASVLMPRITVQQAEEALTRLVRIGVLVPDEHGELRASGADTWMPSSLPRGPISQAIAQLHGEVATLSQQALRGTNFNERHYGALLFAISEERFPAVVAALHELERHLVLAAQEDSGTPNRVYVLGLQLFPVSLYTDCDPAPDALDDTAAKG